MAKALKSSWTAIIIAVVFTLIVAGAGGWVLGARSARPDVAAVASVNGDSITKADLYNRMVVDYGSQAVDQLITEKLVDQELKKAGGSVTAANVDTELTKLTEQFGGQTGLDQALQSNGMTMGQLKDNILFRLKLQAILGKNVPTDDATLQKYFQDNTSQFDKRQVHARHILVATEAEAKAIKAQLDNGADFAALAKDKSTDETNKGQGGDLGTFGRGSMEASFDAAVFALKPNEISAPVETSYGWHIIQLISITGTPPTFETSKEDVKQAVIASGVSSLYQKWMDGIKAAAKISTSLK